MDKKNRIGVILDNEYSIDIRVLNETKHLHKAGFKIFVLCPNYGDQLSFEEIDGITVYRFNLNKNLKNKLFGVMNTIPFYEWLWISKVKWFVKKVNPDFIHAHDLYMSKIAYLGGKRKIPFVLDLHENYPAAILTYRWSSRFFNRLVSRPKAWKKKEKKYLGYASKIIVLSNAFKNDLLKRYPILHAENITVYPNVPDVDQMLSFPINPEIFEKNDKFLLFYFGGISKRRGIFTCFEAIKLLGDKIPNIHLLLIGPVDGHEKIDFENYLNDTSLSGKITHFPWKDISEFPSFTAVSDICLSPIFKNEQHESGVANKIFQYMLFSKPLIVSDCIPQIEIVENSKCGLVFKSNDANDLAEKVMLLQQNPELRSEMGENGRKAVLEKYNVTFYGMHLKQMFLSFSNSHENNS
ncbi:MAG TPA: glycosyltransferase family 4 protein [Tenuifilaceae bacterium]|nr:glycosyltransferase family 4 protein [Tenuifilaceae bacterium]HPJ46201.1 glycosyltransferase family 4 protein [Tenuifilaceae bacterium]HPQ34204.1 glycosyltransferase family 4 protein [Tenuifilaceae bacterium]HRX67861.1 glycosyltransferase family 4 protein [Tenuifilaceae bacterium]